MKYGPTNYYRLGRVFPRTSLRNTYKSAKKSFYYAWAEEAASSLSGSGALSATAEVIRDAASSLSGSGALSATPDLLLGASSSLSGSGTISPTAEVEINASSSLTGSGTISPTAEVEINASSSLSGNGSLSAIPEVSINAASSLSGSGTLSATPDLLLGASSSLTGSGTISSTAEVEINASSSLSGISTISPLGGLLHMATSSLFGSGITFGTPFAITGGKARLNGRATKVFRGRRDRGGSTSLLGSATMVPTAQINILSYVATGGITISGDAPEEPNLFPVVGSGGIVLGGDATERIISSYEGDGGILIDGEAVTQWQLSYVATGGITISGDAPEEPNLFPVVGSGGIVLGGDATERIISSYEGDGGILIDGEAVIQWQLSYVATGGITTSGDALEKLNLLTVGSGGIVLGGDATETIIVAYEGYGEIFVNGEAPVNLVFDFVLDVEWDVRAYFDLAIDFKWDVGELPLKVYQVEGCCRPTKVIGGECEVLPLGTNDSLNCNNQRFIQTIFARNLGEVCQFLGDTNWKWPICSIRKFSTEALDLISDGTNKPPVCNILDEVEYCQIPECFEFCLLADSRTNMGMSVSVVETIFQYESDGSIELLGGYDPVRYVFGESGIEISGNADCVEKLSEYSYTSDGEIILSGEANIVSSHWNQESSGGLIVEGESNIVSPNWNYELILYELFATSGGVTLSGGATCTLRTVYVSTGQSNVYPAYAGINLSGFAGYPILAKVSGGIEVSGNATTAIIFYNYVPTGGINIGGQSDVLSPYWSIEGTGGINLGGEVGYHYLSLAYNVDNSVPLILGGDADNRNSILGDFWYTSITDNVPILSGDADCRISLLSHVASSNPNIIFGGSAGVTSTYRIVGETHMGMDCTIENLEVNYSLDGQPAPTISAPTQTVNTTCGACDQVPMLLNFKHNLEFGSVFREFMLRNGYTIPNSFPLSYNKRLDSWQAAIHYSGIASDNLNHVESWKINVDWTCTAQYADEYFSSSVWRFSLLFTRRNTTTNLDFDTRLLLLFPSEEICATSDRDGFDFSFQFDTRRQKVSTRQNLVVDVVNLYDNITLFKGSYWTTNKLDIRISEDFVKDNLNKQDVTFIIPEKQPQFAI